MSEIDVGITNGRKYETVHPNSPKPQLYLREWLMRAQNAVDISHARRNKEFSAFGEEPAIWPPNVKKRAALSSERFITCALEIAHSLAERICKADEPSSLESLLGDGDRDIILLPTPGGAWIDQIVVQLPYASASTDHSPSFHIDQTTGCDTFQSTSDQSPSQPPLKNDTFSGKLISGDTTSIFDFTRAEFVPPWNPEEPKNISNNPRIIYSLGIVFYEIFSGGEKPPELLSKKIFGQDSLGKGKCEQGEKFYEPLPISQAGSIDLTSALTVLDNLYDDSDDDAAGSTDIGEQTRKKQNVACDNITIGGELLAISVEQLKMQEIPVQLCDLIANMLDCANGDFSSEESYCSFSDILRDLKLMINDPSRFLFGTKLDKLPGLTLDVVFGRESELSTLRNAYHRSMSGKCEMALISGNSGTGKSFLANSLASFASANGAMVLKGKFDQFEQAKPFSAVTTAFDDYCNLLVKEGSPSSNVEIASKLELALGKDAIHLMRVIPSLYKILGNDLAINTVSVPQECVDAQQRLQYLLCQFVETISESTPIFLFLDDLQWADQCSIDLIKGILYKALTSRQKMHFFFLGCCRGDEMRGSQPIWKMSNDIKKFNIHTTLVKLSCISKESLNSIVSNLLCLSPRLTRPLSDIIYYKTKGNPLFFSQLILSLNKEGLLYFSLNRRRWEWDKIKVQSRKLPDDVAIFFTNTIVNLPSEVQSAMCTLACFGCSTDCAVLKALENKLDRQITLHLDVAVAEGLVEKSNGKYHFVHDRIQEAAFYMMSDNDRCLNHLQYGLALWPDTLNSENDSLLFIAAGQINHAGPSLVADGEQGAAIANLNLIAGIKAIEMPDFLSAFKFFENGISFLRVRTNHWEENYDLSLKLHVYASKSCLAHGDLNSLELHSKQVHIHARSFEDKMDTHFISLIALAYSSKLPELIEEGFGILVTHLGEELPGPCSEVDVETCVQQTLSIISEYSDHDLMNYKLMEDRSKIMAMKIYSRLLPSLYMIRPNVLPIVCLRMVTLSLTYGLSPMSPIGFVNFGSLLAALQEVKSGYRFVKIAMGLLDTLESYEVASEVIAIATQVMSFVDPIQTTNEFHLGGRTAGMTAGDMMHAMLNLLLYCAGSFWQGTNLQSVLKTCCDASLLMEQQNHLMWLFQLLPTQRCVSRLIGKGATNNSTEISESPIELALLEKNRHQSKLYYFEKMLTSFLFREYDAMKAFAAKYFPFKSIIWNILFMDFSHIFIDGLVSFWVFRESNDPMWAEQGRLSKQLLRKWVETSPHNFSASNQLLEAEEYFSYEKYDRAVESYDNAIAAARENRFIHFEALAYELAGHFYLKIGRPEISVAYFTESHAKYHEWGALAKASSLFEFVKDNAVKGPMEKGLKTIELHVEPRLGRSGVTGKTKTRKR